MPTKIDVANLAALKLGSEWISSDFKEDSKFARSISLCYDRLLYAELAKNRWAFAIKRASLPALAKAPAWGFERQFLLPTDCLRLDWVDGAGRSEYLANFLPDSTTSFKVEGTRILTDLAAPLKIRYVAKVDNPEQWDPCFLDAFAARLAAEVCEAITQSEAKKWMLWSEYDSSIATARRMSAIQNPPQSIPDDSWNESRL